MKPNMSKTAALRLAQDIVGDIQRRSSTNYVVVGPYRKRDDGTYVAKQFSTYPAAVQGRKEWVVFVALRAMYDSTIGEATYCDAEYFAKYRPGSAAELLSFAIAHVAKVRHHGTAELARAARAI